ncbi:MULTISPECIES: AAA family ATPase [Vibrio]|uniref:Putative ATPase n=1 Tax=Vibrio halioticoli NBRC 102217 TaxID=1219072 RepID=V5FE03_9VIBR|nr:MULTISPECIES: MoxR family ATPase [Vibrio]MPW35987.1 AAA domain-containing protein [Vibrio sp. B1Z05]GAD89868.1 putative ATPase [Vibrio halioticoli NBRC 102217]
MPAQSFQQLQRYLETQVIGQDNLVKQLLVALLADGHILVEGPPGLAKTRAVKSLADCIEGSFHRVQFTPDLLPSDLTGTDVYRPETGEFQFKPGPIFHSLVLADEVNRAPAKVQAAMLEAMAEKQISVGQTTYPLPELFLVMATQNPIEQEGTYPLPEAQLDRFLLHLEVDYPNAQSELDILRLNRGEALGEVSTFTHKLSQQDIFEARRQVLSIHMAETIEKYIIRLIMATREPSAYSEQLSNWIEMGVSPRATIALDRAARANAWLSGRDFVSPEDIHAVIYPVLRHRLLLTYQAQAEGINGNKVIEELLRTVASA